MCWECPRRKSVSAAVDHIIDHTTATAIVAMSDDFAIAALDRLTQRNFYVPYDISVTGIDDIAISQSVGLTTIRQDHRQKGRLASAALDGTRSTEILPVRLTERRSTGTPRAR